MRIIRKLVSVWMMALVGSLLLPLASVAADSGTTYDMPLRLRRKVLEKVRRACRRLRLLVNSLSTVATNAHL